MTEEMDLMILNVGTSPAPIIKSIDYSKPHTVLFIASHGTEKLIGVIMAALEWKNFVPNSIIVSDQDSMEQCVLDIRKGLRDFLVKRGKTENIKILADITGGTKAMVGALVLVMEEYDHSDFSYVAGDKRTEGPHATVVPGHERVVIQGNPWLATGLQGLRRLAYAFNHSQFAAAQEEAENLEKRADDFYDFKGKTNNDLASRPLTHYYQSLSSVICGYRLWDAFDIKNAKEVFGKGMEILRGFSIGRPIFQNVYVKFERDLARLKKITNDLNALNRGTELAEDAGCAYLRDLMVNAVRCAERGKYDDAVARLYSAIEKNAKIALAKHGINNSKLRSEDLEGVPELAKRYNSLIEEADRFNSVLKKVDKTPRAKVGIGLQDSYVLLCARFPKDPVARRYSAIAEELHNKLQARNNSLLAHGYTAVSEENYNKLLACALELNDLKPEDLPRFPTLEANSLMPPQD